MSETIRRVRLEVLVDAPLAPKLVQLSKRAGITGYTLFRTESGEGETGTWKEDLVSGAMTKLIFLAVANQARADAFVDLVEPLLESHGLLVLQSPVDVLRPDKF